MALGESSITKIIGYSDEIHKLLGNDSHYPGMKDSWNTFQYVAKNLGVWAEDTVIGKELQKEMADLADSLYNTIAGTEKLYISIDAFIARQRKLNNIKL